MTLQKTLRFIGGTASPYTQKMLALLRYRHIPHRVIWGMPEAELDKLGIEKPKLAFMPTFLFDDASGNPEAVCDSTPIIRRLEKSYSSRSVLPSDSALAFIDYLLEDFADEWLTKCMFHYRWAFDEDADNAGTLLPLGTQSCLTPQQAEEAKQFFSERQIARLAYVGSNSVTAPVIEESYLRLLSILQQHFVHQPYLLGARPSACDFAFHGQLTQLVWFDPTPRRLAHKLSPRTVAWVDVMSDLSGQEPEADGWLPLSQQPNTLKDLLCEVGRLYVPALLANAKAVQAGEKSWSAMIDGQLWQQRSFPYQAKCLQWINEQYMALNDVDRQSVDAILSGTGCEAVIVS
ncbi:MAG: glutathione S-transferase N-terminal domain-containing protein [Cellvibrionaceae bacterium]